MDKENDNTRRNGFMVTESILIVDDEREIADLLEVYLKNENYDVHKFYNSLDALNYITKEPVSLAILDVMMPEMDGFTLCQKIRQKYLFPTPELISKYTGIARGKAERLEELINEFFEITRFSTNKLVLEPKATNISRMLMQITYEFNPVLRGKICNGICRFRKALKLYVTLTSWNAQ